MLRLKDARKKAGFTQGQVGEMIGVTQSTYSYWENGKVKIDHQSLEKLSKLFGVSIDFLLGNEAPPSSGDDAELWELREQLRRRPGMRTLFSAAKDATEADLLKAVKIIEALKGDTDAD